jgi:hypothetical protein
LRRKTTCPIRNGVYLFGWARRGILMIDAGAYPILTIGIIIFWPFLLLLIDFMAIAVAIPLCILNIIILIFVWKRCSSPQFSLFRGMEIISSHLLSGCANITILYLPAFLVIIYIIALVYSLRSLSKGRQYAQLHWVNLVYRFVEKELV